jgi:hypothetical protein
MNVLFVFLLLLVDLVPCWASVMGPRAQTTPTPAGVTQGTSQKSQGVSAWTRGDPVVTIINACLTDRAFAIETGAESSSTAFDTCLGPCLVVPKGQTVRFLPGRGFVGALTATGSRHEMNFLSNPGETWYDISMEYGMSEETLGPSDQRLQADGFRSLAGETDLLGKANAAWQTTPTAKQRLLLATGYLVGNVGRDLTAVKMDRDAPTLVRHWYQVEADYMAYMVPGSIWPGQQLSRADQVANKKSWHVLTNEMTITTC